MASRMVMKAETRATASIASAPSIRVKKRLIGSLLWQIPILGEFADLHDPPRYCR
jgi:hypothetical protein